MAHKITFIPGDGIGPEVMEAMRRCLEATGVKIEWEKVEAGQKMLDREGNPLPPTVLDSIKRNKVGIKGPIITPVGGGFRSVNVKMRQVLGLYACLRPCRSYQGVRSKYKDIDLVVIRENTEDLYAGIEFEENSPPALDIIKKIKGLSPQEIAGDSAISIKPISRSASERIVRFAFEYALENKRKKVTAVHKANIMKYTDGLFLESARKVAREYQSRIEFEDRLVDNMCMQLIQKPHLYDVLVLPNLYGDIISDLCAGLCGGLGLGPGANIGDNIALFEPIHGAAPKYKGQNKVNPIAMILSGVLMLHYIREKQAADWLEKAVAEVIREGKKVTYDLKDSPLDPLAVGTSQMADAVIEKLQS